MCRYIETIRIVDGRVMALDYHQRRVDATLKAEGRPGAGLKLAEALTEMAQQEGVVKARMVYDREGRIVTLTYSPYAVRRIERLQLVRDDAIDYRFKREDRRPLTALAARKGGADEVIIVKEGRLTDTSYSNIALFDGERWVTPDRPLLRGTMRQRLLDEGRMVEAEVRAGDLDRYTQVSLINAMMPLGTCVVEMGQVLPLRDEE